jgi:peptidoglycan/LPS O-acetylase OafA/YrhL
VAIYIAFFVSIPLVAKLRIIAPIAFMAVAYVLQKHGTHLSFWQCGYYFYLGVLIYQTALIIGRWSGVPGVVLLASWFVFGYGNPDTFELMAVPSLVSSILLCCAAIDKSGVAHTVLRKLAWVGESTYSTYLLHMPIIMVTTITFACLHLDRLAFLGSGWFFAAFILVVFTAGRATFKYFEMPAQEYLRQKWLPKRAVPPISLIADTVG